MSRMILLLIITICLSGCNDDQETSLELSQQEIIFPSVLEIDGKEYFEASRIQCNERKYKVSKEFIGALSKFEQVKIENCQKMIGYRPVAYVRHFNLMEWVRQQIPSEELLEANQEVIEVLR